MVNFENLNWIGNLIWIIDANEMTCTNIENKIIVKMSKEGDCFRGQLHDMPIELFSGIAGNSDGELIIERIIKTAENEFFKLSIQ